MSEIDSTLNSYAVQSSPVSSTGALNGATSICFESDTDCGEIAKYKNDNGNLTFEITEQGSAYNWEMQETPKGFLRVIARDPETNKKVFDSLDERKKENSEYSGLANLRPSDLENFTLNGSDGDDKIKISNLNINQVNLKKGKDSFSSDQSLDKFTGTVTADGIDKDDHFSFGKKDSLFQSMTKKIPKSDGERKTPPAFKITDSSENAFGTNDENITLIADNGQKTQVNVFQRHGAPTYEQSTHGNTIELSQAQITGDNSAEADYQRDENGNITNSSKAVRSSIVDQRAAEDFYRERFLDKNEAIVQKNIDLQAELAEYDEDSSFDRATAQTTLGNHIKQGRPIEDIQNANQVIRSQIKEKRTTLVNTSVALENELIERTEQEIEREKQALQLAIEAGVVSPTDLRKRNEDLEAEKQKRQSIPDIANKHCELMSKQLKDQSSMSVENFRSIHQQSLIRQMQEDPSKIDYYQADIIRLEEPVLSIHTPDTITTGREEDTASI